jgi:acetyl esterase/lipase
MRAVGTGTPSFTPSFIQTVSKTCLRIYIVIAGWDPTRDDNLIAEIMLREAGIKTRLNLYQGTWHLFWVGAPEVEVTRQWMKDSGNGVEWLLAQGK